VSGNAAPPARRTFVLFIDSAPAGAEIWEGDSALGHAPMQISIDNEAARKDARRFEVRRTGFLPYSIVQGPSEENVRINAPLVAAASETTVPAVPHQPGAVTAPAATATSPLLAAVKEHGAASPSKGAKGVAPRVEPTAAAPSPPAATPAPSAATPSPPPSDIRLQR
jgi:serine/threonine-protein kinase